jgi:type III secretion protein T
MWIQLQESEILGYVAAYLRALGFFTFLPLGNINPLIRNALALLSALALGFSVAAPVNLSVISLLYEFLIGVALALPLAILVECVMMWGNLTDAGRGLSIAAIYDASIRGSQKPTGMFLRYAVLALLAMAGVLEHTVFGLVHSTELIPLASVGSEWSAELGSKMLGLLATALPQMFVAYLPLAGLFLVIDLGSGVISRVVPQTLGFAETFILKTAALLFLLLATSQSDLGAIAQSLLRFSAPLSHLLR